MTKEEIEAILVPVDAPLSRFPSIQLDIRDAKDFTNGKQIQAPVAAGGSNRLVRVYYGHEFIGIGRMAGNELTADKVFNTRLQHENI